jgi:YebC/PmpR family DNA-binding regulatory protein
MSGHSKWSKVKHIKKVVDAQRSRVFSKMARLITVAARDGGNPDENPKLRDAIDKARSFNMPSVNIERAIKRGTGEVAGREYEEFLFEAYGPHNVAIIIEGITDNRNRALSEIKQLLNKNNGKLAAEGSVQWLFDRKGGISIDLDNQTERFRNKEAMELAVIDAGAEDLSWRENVLQVYTSINGLEKVKENLKQKGIKIESSGLEWVAKDEIELGEKERQAAERLFSALDENDDVQEIYSNLKL